MLNARLTSRLTDCGLNIDLNGFEIRRDIGPVRRKAGIVSGNIPQTDLGNESGTQNTILKAKNGNEIRSRLNSNLRANSVSFNPEILPS